MTVRQTFQKLESLLHAPAPVEEHDQSWPDETAGYWEDNSVNHYELPPTAVLDDKWAPTADQVVPGYRGTEEHGVPYDASVNYIVPKDQTVAEDDEKAEQELLASVEITQETEIAPLPVVVRELPVPVARQNKLAVTSYTIAPGATQHIVPQNHQRDRVKIRVIDPANWVYVHPDKQAAASVGYPVTNGAELELETTEKVYAYAPATNSNPTIVYLLEEYSVATHEHTV